MSSFAKASPCGIPDQLELLYRHCQGDSKVFRPKQLHSTDNGAVDIIDDWDVRADQAIRVHTVSSTPN